MRPPTRRCVLAALGSAATLGTAGCTGLRAQYLPRTHRRDADPSGDSGPWPTLGHDARRTASADGPGPDADARLTRLHGANHFPERQVVVGPDFFLFVVRRWFERGEDGDDPFSGVVAVDKSGAERWRFGTEPDVGVPTVVGNAVVVEDTNGTRAVDAETGAVNWYYRSGYGFPHVSPAVRDGRVYVGGRRFLALDAATGERLWRTEEEMPAAQTCSATADGVVVSNGYDGNGGGLFCLDAEGGSVRWEADVASTYDPAAVGERRCFSVDEEGVLSAVSMADGSVEWTRNRTTDGEHLRYEQPVLADGLVLVGGWNAPLRAFDPATGETAWTAGPADERHYAPVAADDGIYGVTREGTVYEVGFDGTERWRRSIARTVTCAPSLADGALYFGSRSGETVEEWRGGFDRFGP
ncbi:outer membrane protein assembly factor BamB family protein [Halopelagius longus]|uniref:PQQ-like domain-containing protein n=1 Tax=Halopelagius longus TaxID=1236180 RepID=A0A1H0Y2X5_9EURY|nr:PQQ-binding-like beta-propeller repeat protein [Halopelagius longus]RDI72245.1 hypothetical protein DWB78_11275 [Halopelagius longus]SDQ09445.1 PQQ-like domain-containing protein [Halopelagius longus]